MINSHVDNLIRDARALLLKDVPVTRPTLVTSDTSSTESDSTVKNSEREKVENSEEAKAEGKILKWNGRELRSFVVTHVTSPSEIHVRPEWLDNRWTKYERIVERSLLAKASERLPDDEVVSVGCSLGVSVQTNLYRGKVIKVDPVNPNVFDVMLIDKGTVVKVTRDDCRPLSEEMRKLNAFSHCVTLDGVEPFGSGNWALTVAEEIREILQPHLTVFLDIKVSIFVLI